jgi:predicted transcriptional regulator
MYKEKPWTLEKKKIERTRKSNYIKEKESDLAISISRVREFFEQHKEQTFTANQIAEALNLSEGTISSIMNRLISIGDISVVTMQRPHWAPVFQHSSCAPFRVPFRYTKEDPILSIISTFKNNKNEVYTKEDLLKKVGCSESMLRRSLQILLTNGEIKLVGSIEGCAQYQHKSGNQKETPVYTVMDSTYSSLAEFLQKNNLTKHGDLFRKELKGKSKLFYTSTGLRKKYPINEMDKIAKKVDKRSIISSLFKK